MIVMMTMISPKIVMMMLIVKAMIRSTMMVFSPPRPHQGWLRHFAICCTVCNLSSPEKTQMGTFPVFFGLFCWCYLRFSAFFMCICTSFAFAFVVSSIFNISPPPSLLVWQWSPPPGRRTKQSSSPPSSSPESVVFVFVVFVFVFVAFVFVVFVFVLVVFVFVFVVFVFVVFVFAVFVFVFVVFEEDKKSSSPPSSSLECVVFDQSKKV